jgi:hypothetical protein
MRKVLINSCDSLYCTIPGAVICCAAVLLLLLVTGAELFACTLECSGDVPATAEVGEEVTFTAVATASNCSGEIGDYYWQFGDGYGGDGATTTWTYTEAGTYNWHMHAGIEDQDCFADGTITVVESTACVLECSGEGPATAEGGEEVTFTLVATATDCEGEIGDQWWQFGDGHGGNEAILTWTYTEAGTYTWRTHASIEDQDCWEEGTITVFAGEFPAAEREALEALYNSTNGPGWTINDLWLGEAGTECMWYGVTCNEDRSVIHLSLFDNGLAGQIPPQLENLVGLYFLNLADNQLTGSIPAELGRLTNLEVLALGRNQLTGPIPPELGNLQNLTWLGLPINQLSGTIPAELANLSKLQELYLHINDLSGPIPPALGNLEDLINISLEQNSLSGTIPPELGTLANLTDLWLHDNRLSGQLPEALGNLSSLRALWLAGNQLTGELPRSLLDLNDLIGTDLRWNGLYTSDQEVREFLNSKQVGGDLEGTQTIAPADLTAVPQGQDSIALSWTPIRYTAHDGAYRVLISTNPEGPFTTTAETENKSASTVTVEGLTPGQLYYFVGETFTEPHANNQSRVTSELTPTVSATTASPDQPGSLQFTHAIVHISEGESKALSVSRSQGTAGQVTVDLTVLAGTATQGVDLTGVAGTLVWGDGDGAPKSLMINAHDDTLPEGQEHLEVGLQGFTGGSTAGDQASTVLLIDDNDFRGGSEAKISSQGSDPSVAASPTGDRVVAWAAEEGGTSSLFAQQYGVTGASQGDSFEIGDAAGGDQRSPAVTYTPTLRFAAAWISTSCTSGSECDATCRGQWYDESSQADGEELVFDDGSSGAPTAVDVARRSDNGEHVAAWVRSSSVKAGSSSVYMRYFNDDGTMAGEAIRVDTRSDASAGAVAVAGDGAGGAVVVWVGETQEDECTVMVRRFDSAGTPYGDPLQVSSGSGTHDMAPDVAWDATGGFVVVWEGEQPDRSGRGIFGRRFDDAGAPSGERFQADTAVDLSSGAPVIAINDNGDAWIVWEREDQSGQVGIVGRFLPHSGSPQDEHLLNAAASGDSARSPSISLTNDGAFTVLYAIDDTMEGDGGIGGRAFNQPLPAPRRGTRHQ